MLRKWIKKKLEVTEVTLNLPGVGITFRPAEEMKTTEAATPAPQVAPVSAPVPVEKPAPERKKPRIVRPKPEPIAFDEALALLARETFAEEKLRALRDLAPRLRVTVAQAEEILARFRFSDDRLAALKILKPRLTDPENGLNLASLFTGADERSVVRKLLG